MLVPDADALKGATQRQTFNRTFTASSKEEMTVTWKVPIEEGSYWLALVTARPGDKPVVSQRVVRAIGLHPKTNQLNGKHVILIGGGPKAEDWLKKQDIKVTTALPQNDITVDVVLISDSQRLTDADKAHANALLDYVKSGGRLVLLDPPKWTWDAVVNYQTVSARSSRAFAYPGAAHHLLEGIAPEFLRRWNGSPNVIADHAVQTALTDGRNVLWIEDPGKPVVTSLQMGRGEILICLLKIQQRLLRSSAEYDPVAERMMINLLTQ
jgi:hypothetical protein